MPTWLLALDTSTPCTALALGRVGPGVRELVAHATHDDRAAPASVHSGKRIRGRGMSFGEADDGGAVLDDLTARGRDWPSVRQYNVFLANRMGALLDLVRRFELTDVKIVAMTIVETADCAIIRLVPSSSERAYEILQAAKLPRGVSRPLRGSSCLSGLPAQVTVWITSGRNHST